MDEQLNIFKKPPPTARKSDPESSHEAAEEVTKSGARAKQCSEVLEMLRAMPGLTSMELANAHGVDRYMVARRLSELRYNGLAYNGTIRECRIGRRRAMTWFPTGEREIK